MDKEKLESAIREQIINISKGLFDNYVSNIQNYDEIVREIMPQGIPSEMIIAEFAPCTRSMNKIKNGYRSNEIARAWRYSNKSIEPIQMSKEKAWGSNRDKNYKETYARYAFSIEKKILYFNIFYAPLSAEGYVYHIIESDGVLKLSEAELVWLS